MSQTEHRFGGEWTEDKLKRLEDYLKAYRTIFKSPKLKDMSTWYVDAFSGTGFRSERRVDPRPGTLRTLSIFGDQEPPAPTFTPPRRGSAQIALGLASPFDHYLFVERKQDHFDQLEAMIQGQFAHLLGRCDLRRQDANTALCVWCRSIDWNCNRAVVFLDPYGMQVEWKTVEALAATKAIDLWYLFPLATLARMMPKNGLIIESWRNKLNAAVGTLEWAEHFYPDLAESIFDGSRIRFRDAGAEKLRAFINSRLSTCFECVADGLILRNSTGSPMFLLCFAAANKKGAPLALRIANHILNPQMSQVRRKALGN
jgi:three-Cys-motif partner protein